MVLITATVFSHEGILNEKTVKLSQVMFRKEIDVLDKSFLLVAIVEEFVDV